MRFEQIEQGNKNIRVSIIDSDGRAIMPTLNAQLNVQIRPHESDASVPLALVIQQVRLPRFGEYSIDLAIDNRQGASIPLYVRQAPVPQQPASFDCSSDLTGRAELRVFIGFLVGFAHYQRSQLSVKSICLYIAFGGFRFP
jgi:hypothetical protein